MKIRPISRKHEDTKLDCHPRQAERRIAGDEQRRGQQLDRGITQGDSLLAQSDNVREEQSS